MVPKTTIMLKQLNSGFAERSNQVRYLKWVERSLPENAVILAGGKSDLITVSQNVKKPIVYNAIYSAALLIKSNEIPGVNPDDFSIISELENKDNFEKNKYIVLEDDINLWRGRLTGVEDNVFSTVSAALRARDYSIKVYKYNSALKKSIYELSLRGTEDL